MASSSSPSLPITIPHEGYDVFISFRGKDTRNNFTSHLHAALRQKQILSFIDSKHLRAGDEISASLLNAIEGSRLYLVIISPNYASSKWCLLELEKILECKKMNGKAILPVFYKVDPSNMRYQTGSFREVFHKHEEREKMDRVQRWRAALNEAGNLSGWDWPDTKPESKLIEKIVKRTVEILNKLSSIYSRGLVGIDRINLVGIDLHVEKIKSLLCMESPSSDVCSVGIWGMGGIGKTTIAQALFDSMHSLFSGCFFANVREEIARHGVDAFKIKLFQEALDDEEVLKGTQSLSLTFIRERLRLKKVLIVFDDVDDSILMQLPEIKAHHYLFGVGSKVVMTSRDKHALKNLSVDEIYMVEGLTHDESVELLSLEAFKDEDPPIGYMELLERVVSYAQGNPLAIKVFGSALSGRDKQYWKCTLDQIGKFPKKNVETILRVSYDGLSTNEQSIFLDIACFFKGEKMEYATEILDIFHDVVYCSVINLIDKCLVTISYHNTLKMHNLLQEMGQAIVREESTSLGNRSRLYDPDEICDVLMNKKGTEAIQSIFFDLQKVRNMHLPIDAFMRMDNLQLLKVTGWNPKVHIFYDGLQFYNAWLRYLSRKAFTLLGWDPQVLIFCHGLQFSSKKLRYLHWEAFPLKFFASTIYVENLVKLSLPSGKFKQLWTGPQHLVNLKWVDLSCCEYLTEIPDLSKAKNIEHIDLSFCESLVTLHSSVQHLTNLQNLDFHFCKSLKILPSRLDSKSLGAFDLRGCRNVENCPYIVSPVLGYLDISMTKIKEVPPFFHHSKRLRQLRAAYLSCITKFPNVSNCITLLRLRGAAIEEVPSSIKSFTRLFYLDLSDNQNLSRLPTTIWELKSLSTLDLSDCPKLKTLPEILRPIEKTIRYVNLSDCYNLKALPNKLSHLKSLRELHISNCKFIRFIPRLPQSLLLLQADNCESLETSSIRSNCQMAEILLKTFYKFYKSSKSVKSVTKPENTSYQAVIFPGTEIPQCFPHRSVGPSITVPMPLNPSELLGISFCIVCRSNSRKCHAVNLKMKCYNESKTGDLFEGQISVPVLCHVPKSDHLLLGNCCIGYLDWSKCSTASIEFYDPSDLMLLVKQSGVYFHFNEESSDSWGEEYSNSGGEEYPTDSWCEEYSNSSGEEYPTDSWCEEYFNSSGEEYPTDNDEDCWESMGKVAHG